MHGLMRSTLDIDILAYVRLEHIPLLNASMKADYYVDERMIMDAVINRSSFNLIYFETAFKVDVFVPKDREFDWLELERRSSVSLT